MWKFISFSKTETDRVLEKTSLREKSINLTIGDAIGRKVDYGNSWGSFLGNHRAYGNSKKRSHRRRKRNFWRYDFHRV